MAPNICFEFLSFVPFSTEESLINNENDPDVNFCNDVFTLDTQYLATDKLQRNLKPFFKSHSPSYIRISEVKTNILKPLNSFTCLLISISALLVFQKHGLMI